MRQWTLAKRNSPCFTPNRVQQAINAFGRSKVVQPCIAAALAVLIFACSLLSVGWAHRLVHNDSSGDSHGCIVCSLAKGQVNAAPTAPVFIGFTSFLVFSAPVPREAPCLLLDCFASSRAPPPAPTIA